MAITIIFFLIYVIGLIPGLLPLIGKSRFTTIESGGSERQPYSVATASIIYPLLTIVGGAGLLCSFFLLKDHSTIFSWIILLTPFISRMSVIGTYLVSLPLIIGLGFREFYPFNF